MSACDSGGAARYTRAMLSRRLLLLGPSGALAAAALPAAAAGEVAGAIVLMAGRDGFNGAVPGPVIRARRGGEITVRLVNGLDEPLALCWHGVRQAGAADSGAPVAPGAEAALRFTVPDAGTFFYRAVPRSRQEAGLYGALVVAEPSPPAVDQDRVLVFDSRADGGARRWNVDGAVASDVAVAANERLRLRFVNASAVHALQARIGGHRVTVMALDGEPAEPFASRDGAVTLAPGNRADVFVDATLAPGSVAPVSFTASGGGEPPRLRLVYGPAPARAAPPGPPGPLPANPLPERINLAGAVRAALILGAAPPPDASVLFTAARGRTVVLAVENRGALAHRVYLGGHHCRVLDRLDDGWKPYWLDTLAVAPGETVRVAFVADVAGRFAIESGAISGGGAAAEYRFEVR